MKVFKSAILNGTKPYRPCKSFAIPKESLLYHLDYSRRSGTMDFGPDRQVFQSSGFRRSSDKGGAHYFDGSNYQLSVNNIPIQSGALTICCWIKPEPIASGQSSILADAGQSASVGFIWMYLMANGSLNYQYSTGSSYLNVTSSGYFNDYYNTWLHVAVVVDYSNKTLVFYRNAEQVGSAVLTGTPQTPTAKRHYVGAYRFDQGYFKGLLNLVSLYNRALTDSEIFNHYKTTRHA